MTRYSPEPGDVVLVIFPFTDSITEKKRPALVISPSTYFAKYHDVVILALTSQPQPESSLRLDYWREAGLKSPTWIKPLITTLELSIIERQLGVLSAKDVPRALDALESLIGFDLEKKERKAA